MAEHQIFVESLRSTGDFAGVFEYDGDTGYFYLYDLKRPAGKKVVDTIWILDAITDVVESEIAVLWNEGESDVGLFIGGKLWAVFDLVARKKYGSQYRKGTDPQIPRHLAEAFIFP